MADELERCQDERLLEAARFITSHVVANALVSFKETPEGKYCNQNDIHRYVSRFRAEEESSRQKLSSNRYCISEEPTKINCESENAIVADSIELSRRPHDPMVGNSEEISLYSLHDDDPDKENVKVRSELNLPNDENVGIEDVTVESPEVSMFQDDYDPVAEDSPVICEKLECGSEDSTCPEDESIDETFSRPIVKFTSQRRLIVLRRQKSADTVLPEEFYIVSPESSLGVIPEDKTFESPIPAKYVETLVAKNLEKAIVGSNTDTGAIASPFALVKQCYEESTLDSLASRPGVNTRRMPLSKRNTCDVFTSYESRNEHDLPLFDTGSTLNETNQVSPAFMNEFVEVEDAYSTSDNAVEKMVERITKNRVEKDTAVPVFSVNLYESRDNHKVEDEHLLELKNESLLGERHLEKHSTDHDICCDLNILNDKDAESMKVDQASPWPGSLSHSASDKPSEKGKLIFEQTGDSRQTVAVMEQPPRLRIPKTTLLKLLLKRNTSPQLKTELWGAGITQFLCRQNSEIFDESKTLLPETADEGIQKSLDKTESFKLSFASSTNVKAKLEESVCSTESRLVDNEEVIKSDTETKTPALFEDGHERDFRSEEKELGLDSKKTEMYVISRFEQGHSETQATDPELRTPVKTTSDREETKDEQVVKPDQVTSSPGSRSDSPSGRPRGKRKFSFEQTGELLPRERQHSLSKCDQRLLSKEDISSVPIETSDNPISLDTSNLIVIEQSPRMIVPKITLLKQLLKRNTSPQLKTELENAGITNLLRRQHSDDQDQFKALSRETSHEDINNIKVQTGNFDLNPASQASTSEKELFEGFSSMSEINRQLAGDEDVTKNTSYKDTKTPGILDDIPRKNCKETEEAKLDTDSKILKKMYDPSYFEEVHSISSEIDYELCNDVKIPGDADETKDVHVVKREQITSSHGGQSNSTNSKSDENQSSDTSQLSKTSVSLDSSNLVAVEPTLRLIIPKTTLLKLLLKRNTNPQMKRELEGTEIKNLLRRQNSEVLDKGKTMPYDSSPGDTNKSKSQTKDIEFNQTSQISSTEVEKQFDESRSISKMKSKLVEYEDITKNTSDRNTRTPAALEDIQHKNGKEVEEATFDPDSENAKMYEQSHLEQRHISKLEQVSESCSVRNIPNNIGQTKDVQVVKPAQVASSLGCKADSPNGKPREKRKFSFEQTEELRLNQRQHSLSKCDQRLQSKGDPSYVHIETSDNPISLDTSNPLAREKSPQLRIPKTTLLKLLLKRNTSPQLKRELEGPGISHFLRRQNSEVLDQSKVLSQEEPHEDIPDSEDQKLVFKSESKVPKAKDINTILNRGQNGTEEKLETHPHKDIESILRPNDPSISSGQKDQSLVNEVIDIWEIPAPQKQKGRSNPFQTMSENKVKINAAAIEDAKQLEDIAFDIWGIKRAFKKWKISLSNKCEQNTSNQVSLYCNDKEKVTRDKIAEKVPFESAATTSHYFTSMVKVQEKDGLQGTGLKYHAVDGIRNQRQSQFAKQEFMKTKKVSESEQVTCLDKSFRENNNMSESIVAVTSIRSPWHRSSSQTSDTENEGKRSTAFEDPITDISRMKRVTKQWKTYASSRHKYSLEIGYPNRDKEHSEAGAWNVATACSVMTMFQAWDKVSEERRMENISTSLSPPIKQAGARGYSRPKKTVQSPDPQDVQTDMCGSSKSTSSSRSDLRHSLEELEWSVGRKENISTMIVNTNFKSVERSISTGCVTSGQRRPLLSMDSVSKLVNDMLRWARLSRKQTRMHYQYVVDARVKEDSEDNTENSEIEPKKYSDIALTETQIKNISSALQDDIKESRFDQPNSESAISPYRKRSVSSSTRKQKRKSSRVPYYRPSYDEDMAPEHNNETEDCDSVQDLPSPDQFGTTAEPSTEGFTNQDKDSDLESPSFSMQTSPTVLAVTNTSIFRRISLMSNNSCLSTEFIECSPLENEVFIIKPKSSISTIESADDSLDELYREYVLGESHKKSSARIQGFLKEGGERGDDYEATETINQTDMEKSEQVQLTKEVNETEFETKTEKGATDISSLSSTYLNMTDQELDKKRSSSKKNVKEADILVLGSVENRQLSVPPKKGVTTAMISEQSTGMEGDDDGLNEPSPTLVEKSDAQLAQRGRNPSLIALCSMDRLLPTPPPDAADGGWAAPGFTFLTRRRPISMNKPGLKLTHSGDGTMSSRLSSESQLSTIRDTHEDARRAILDSQHSVPPLLEGGLGLASNLPPTVDLNGPQDDVYSDRPSLVSQDSLVPKQVGEPDLSVSEMESVHTRTPFVRHKQVPVPVQENQGQPGSSRGRADSVWAVFGCCWQCRDQE